MKKYFQISFFLAIFGILVLIRNSRAPETHFVATNPNPTGNSNPTPSVSSSPSQTNQQASQPAQNMQGTMMNNSLYKDGTYTGSTQDAFYGNVQIQVVVSGGKITNVNFLQYPNDNPTSQYINSQAMPLLQQEVVQAQNGNVNMISGASATSQAFLQSIADALSQAK